jgi:thiamine pyrophosphokinase
MTQKIIIISGGRLGDPAFYQKRVAAPKSYFVICCDKGIRHLEGLRIKPDVIIGDMDSADPLQLSKYENQGIKIIKYPQDKDATDTMLALEYALWLKPEAIEIWGALGGRIDHSLANLFLLNHGAKAGVDIKLVDEYCEAFVVHKEYSFPEAVGQTVSLFVLETEAKGITLQGFQYPLNNETLEMISPRGISNVIVSSQALIKIDSGWLLVIRYWQKDYFPEAV